ncbi:MAG TPA: hypothetical protein VFS45_06005, partial [Sphingomicrobium sp.]|nr:hypothetical protein [Sphingomicrobium sp.]
TAPADAFAVIGGSPERELAAVIAQLRSILSGPRIQALCLECGPGATTGLGRAERSDWSLVAALADWF